MNRTCLVPLLVLATLTIPSAARADDRGQLAALTRTRAEVYVTNPDGVERRGRLVAVSDEGLRLSFAGRVTVVPWAEVICVERRGDPIWDGAAKGAAISALLYASVAIGAGADLDDAIHFIAEAALVWGAVGATIDAFNVGRSTVYVGTADLSRWHGQRGLPQDRGVVIGGRVGF